MSKKNVITKRKLGWSDEMVSTVALGTMTFGVQNTEEEGHEQVRPSQPDKCSANEKVKWMFYSRVPRLELHSHNSPS